MSKDPSTYSYRKQNAKRRWDIEKRRTLHWLQNHHPAASPTAASPSTPDLLAKCMKAYSPSDAFLVAIDAWLEDGGDPSRGIAMGPPKAHLHLPWGAFPLTPDGEAWVPVRGPLTADAFQLSGGADEPVVVLWRGRRRERGDFLGFERPYHEDIVDILNPEAEHLWEWVETQAVFITLNGTSVRAYPVSNRFDRGNMKPGIPSPKELRKLLKRIYTSPTQFRPGYNRTRSPKKLWHNWEDELTTGHGALKDRFLNLKSYPYVP